MKLRRYPDTSKALEIKQRLIDRKSSNKRAKNQCHACDGTGYQHAGGNIIGTWPCNVCNATGTRVPQLTLNDLDSKAVEAAIAPLISGLKEKKVLSNNPD